MKHNSDPSQCCLPFDPSLWDEKTHIWTNKMFLRDDVVQIMHVPLNMSSVVNRMFKKIETADAMPETQDFLMLAYDPSPWRSEIHMTITKEIPDGKVVRLSGTFVSKIFDGPYNHVPKWITAMDTFLATRNQKSLKYYFHFAYCPKCVKKYGHNYCIVFAQVL